MTLPQSKQPAATNKQPIAASQPNYYQTNKNTPQPKPQPKPQQQYQPIPTRPKQPPTMIPPPARKQFKEDYESRIQPMLPSVSEDTEEEKETKIEPYKYNSMSTAISKPFSTEWTHKPLRSGNPGVEITGKFKTVLQPHFVYYVIGRPGAGKTFMVEELILNPDMYYRKFNRVLIYSPYGEMPTLDTVPGRNYWPELKIEQVYEQIAEIAQTNPKSNILIIIDDFIAQMKKCGNNDQFMNLFYNRRKLIPQGTISFILTGQKYIVLPPNIRTVLTGLFIFPVPGNDWSTICREYSIGSNTKISTVIVNRHWEHHVHNFVFVGLISVPGKVVAGTYLNCLKNAKL
jgi:hypothetical protein